MRAAEHMGIFDPKAPRAKMRAKTLVATMSPETLKYMRRLTGADLAKVCLSRGYSGKDYESKPGQFVRALYRELHPKPE